MGRAWTICASAWKDQKNDQGGDSLNIVESGIILFTEHYDSAVAFYADSLGPDSFPCRH